MENKTKVKVAVVIAIIILAVIFIFMVIFVKGNKNQKNPNIPTKGEAGYVDPTVKNTTTEPVNETAQEPVVTQPTVSNDVVSLGVKFGWLVKINSDLNAENIIELESGYSEFCYDNSKVYILTINRDGTNLIDEIDLSKSSYTPKNIITSSDYGNISNIECYEGKLYFMAENGQIIEYSIEESYVRALNNPNEANGFVINKDKNVMYVSYRPNGANAGVYVFDFTANTFSQIISLNDLPGKLILNGNSLVIDVKEYASLYVYDMEQNVVNGIGADNYFEDIENQITFYNDIILYTNGLTIDLKNANGESFQDGWYTLNDSTIADISLLDSTKLQIARYDENGRGGGNINRSVVIDLVDGTTTEKPIDVYTDVIRIK